MRIRIPALVLLFCATIGAGVSFAGELWDEAVSHYSDYGDLLPGRLRIRFDQYNGRGRLVSTETSEYAVTVGPDGEIESRVIFASKNGEDVTGDRDQETGGAPFGGGGEEGQSDSPFAGLQISPFDPEAQDQVTVTDTGRSEVVNGVRTRTHMFEIDTGTKTRTTGTAWIAEETGNPVKLTAQIEPLPGYIDEFRMDQSFESDSEGRWYLSRMEFVGEGNILFVRRRIESEFVFWDYFQPPEGHRD